jgi:O-acetyl-ADP-ribose deacetylase (regulator of RNase III)
MQAPYVGLNIKALCEEYPEIEEAVVRDVYHAADKDCEAARNALADMCGRKRQRAEDVVREDTGFALREVRGDLFAGCEMGDSLCHCVSVDMAMGKGIAVEFKKRFASVPELKRQGAAVGSGAVLPRPAASATAFVYYLVTKEKYWNKPTLAAVRGSLEWMREHAVAHGATGIAMPRIGCGLDGLRWEDVRELLTQVFGGTNIKLSVFQL